MIPIALWYVLATIFAPQPLAPVPTRGQVRQSLPASAACLPLAFRVVRTDTAEIRRRYRMPTATVNTSRIERMPVAVRRPCVPGDTATRVVP